MEDSRRLSGCSSLCVLDQGCVGLRDAASERKVTERLAFARSSLDGLVAGEAEAQPRFPAPARTELEP
jgi:hypothetical protein